MSDHTPQPLLSVSPVLRWAGGKRRLLEVLEFALPSDVGPGYAGRLVEPFAGGASFFFWLQPKRALLSDANAELMNVYRCVRRRPAEVIHELERLSVSTSADSYYAVRTAFKPIGNTRRLHPKHAAQFIYLNRLCFNGLYRVNRAGRFNVPYGHRVRTPDQICSRENISTAGRLLERAVLRHGGYETALDAVRTGDFVYLDPPYLPAGESSEFVHYTREGFHIHDHRLLLRRMAEDTQARYLMSNSYHPGLIREAKRLQLDYCEVAARRSISSRIASRGDVKELLIANYELPTQVPFSEKSHESFRDPLAASY